ncbi:PH domain-containing protein [Gryllotalpicola reticulitermitis]|uniref:PH domain-containing protein n=1 Tax=Gryllotalpicola reticulitermitis TaxID=1184153 RepID=A0ABV8QB81_9MICO
MTSDVTLKPRFGMWLCVIVWALLALALVSIFVQRFWGDLFVYAPAFLLVAWLCWMLFGVPSVTVGEHGVGLVNVFRTVRIPWSAIIDVQPSFTLLIRTKRRAYHAWAAPGAAQASTFATLGADQQVRLNLMLPDDGRQIGDALRFDRRADSADSTLAAGYIRREWDRWQHRAAESGAPVAAAEVRSTVNLRECLIALALVALLVAGILH